MDKNPPANDNSSIAQEQTLKALTKDTSSSSSVSAPVCHGKQLIKLKPPPVAWSATSSQNKPHHVAWAATSASNKHDDDLSTTTSSSIHSGTQAFELLIEDNDLYFNVKQPANTNFPENKTQPIAQHILNCNMGSNTAEDVTGEIHQSIEPQLVQQQELMVPAPTPQNVESVTMKKKQVDVLNVYYEDEFKECVESYNIQNGADSFDIIMNAIAFYGGWGLQHLTHDSEEYSRACRQYRCKQHEGCPFQISFGRQQTTGMSEMKNCHFIHSGIEVASTAKGGRK